jgi:hypothetical protein
VGPEDRGAIGGDVITYAVNGLVPPKEAGRTKTRLIKEMLARMNAKPDRVLFPKSNLR